MRRACPPPRRWRTTRRQRLGTPGSMGLDVMRPARPLRHPEAPASGLLTLPTTRRREIEAPDALLHTSRRGRRVPAALVHRLRGLPARRRVVGAPADVPRLRPRRVLRLLPRAPRDRAQPRVRASAGLLV